MSDNGHSWRTKSVKSKMEKIVHVTRFKDNKAHNIIERTFTVIHKEPLPPQCTTERTVGKYKSYLLHVDAYNITYSQEVTNPSIKTTQCCLTSWTDVFNKNFTLNVTLKDEK